ncbi:MAG: trigger factor [Elusimicrobia bacterium GWF2_52_66]|nr:MAG: trigger factor [Elusimicrobia bacterium GWA2_51_34]OGR87337.1 MAG: trigger factor [Elusimicrobia bacterium GWF2_52_66]HAF94923.1 trigger factor [Elusimicrobiota bacterium]HCE97503.1 trigger factor [Elusimicrobiota bacterium]
MNILGFRDRIKKVKQEGCVYTFAVNVDSSALSEATAAALARLQAVVSLPGFRVGKVPVPMIKGQFPSMVKDEVIEAEAKSAVTEILKNNKLTPVVSPSIKNLRYDPDKTLYFEVLFECNPQIEPRGYEKIAVTRKIHKVTDEDVEKYLTQVREYNAYLKPAPESESAGMAHFVIVDYETFENGVKVEGGSVKGEIVNMASPQTIAGLAEAVSGAKKGETREFDAPFGDKKMRFRVTVSEIKQKIVPELDGNFLKEAGAATVEELKANVRKLLEKTEAEKTEKDLFTQLEDALIKNNPMPLPPTLVSQETRELLELMKKRMPADDENFREETFLEKLKPVAERNLSLTFLLHHIARKENISAGDAELKAELDKVLSRLGSDEEKTRARELFDNRREYILASIMENRTMDMVKSKAIIKEETR